MIHFSFCSLLYLIVFFLLSVHILYATFSCSLPMSFSVSLSVSLSHTHQHSLPLSLFLGCRRGCRAAGTVNTPGTLPCLFIAADRTEENDTFAILTQKINKLAQYILGEAKSITTKANVKHFHQ